jgi:uncharacterized Zn finger protein (UPF0148 family)
MKEGDMTIRVCPRCKPIGVKVTTADGRRIGFVPEALYVGHLVTRPYEGRMQPPTSCRNCGTPLVEQGGKS